MSEDVYYNEPGYEREQGTEEGDKKNEAYLNIIIYKSNIKFAMIDQIKNPPKGFEEVIQKHFFLKKDEILEECEKWIELSKTKEVNYQDGLVTSHNGHWSKTF